MIVALTRSDSCPSREALERLAAEAPDDGCVARIVVSDDCSDRAAYRAAFATAERALRLLAPVAPASAVLDLRAARVLTLLFREGGEAELRTFARTVLRPLLEQRPTVSDALVRTLAAYLDNRGSPSRTAASLGLHVNTLYYRLERLRALLGDDFASPDRALDFQVALRARRLIGGAAEKSS
jgi:DNA-binding PucR family transcriptional regulator